MKVFLKKCINCGVQFDASSRPNKCTCSTECRVALVRFNRTDENGDALDHHHRRCILCKKVYDQRRSNTDNPLYCSWQCQKSYEGVCRYCGQKYRGTPDSQFCSHDCKELWEFDRAWDEAHATKLHKCACPACDEQVPGNTKFCSEYCRLSTNALKRILGAK